MYTGLQDSDGHHSLSPTDHPVREVLYKNQIHTTKLNMPSSYRSSITAMHTILELSRLVSKFDPRMFKGPGLSAAYYPCQSSPSSEHPEEKETYMH